MKEIIVYTGPKCHACHSYKELLNKNNIPFTERSISNDEYFEELNQYEIKSIPFTVILNDNIMEQAFIGLRDPKTLI